MDNLTHTLVGLTLAESGLKRTSRLATTTLVIAANLPDVDGLSYLFGGSTTGLTFRRGWTHGVLAMFVLPLLLVAVLLGWERLRRQPPGSRAGWLLVLAAIGVWSHPLLDLLNTYGVRLLMPFSSRWFYGDALFIIDPWVWLTLLLGVALARRRWKAPIQTPVHAGRPAQAALVVSAVYARAWARGSRSAVRRIERETPEGRATRSLASPVFGNPLRRDIVRERTGSYEVGWLRLAPWQWAPLGKRSIGNELPGSEAAAHTQSGAAFLAWARFPVYHTVTVGDSIEVTITDARYEGRGNRSWASVSVRVPAATRKEGL